MPRDLATLAPLELQRPFIGSNSGNLLIHSHIDYQHWAGVRINTNYANLLIHVF